ncbi:MAG: hypothetical protein JXR64_05890, partial [Spirochaetales bacterium]|nr:hypothetical protein [Spirochaetales bacterium]
MKNLIKFLITLSIITTFVACDFDYSVKKTALDATLQNSNATTKNTSENANSAKFSVASCNGTLTNNKDQEIVVTFNNGYVDNSAANLAKIKVYTLANSTVSTVYTRTALTVKSTRVETTAGNSIVYLVLDLDVAAIADLLDVEIDPSITADGGAKTLNQDDDEVAGESDDDIYYKGFTLNDTNASMNLTYLTTGVQRLSPQTTFTLNLSPNATYDLVGTPSRTPYSSYTKDSLLGGFV